MTPTGSPFSPGIPSIPGCPGNPGGPEGHEFSVLQSAIEVMLSVQQRLCITVFAIRLTATGGTGCNRGRRKKRSRRRGIQESKRGGDGGRRTRRVDICLSSTADVTSQAFPNLHELVPCIVSSHTKFVHADLQRPPYVLHLIPQDRKKSNASSHSQDAETYAAQCENSRKHFTPYVLPFCYFPPPSSL